MGFVQTRTIATRIRRDYADITGGCGNPSKMPGLSYGIPASECKTGRKLAQVEGSVCSTCYAFERGNYAYDNVVKSQWKRLDLYNADPIGWQVGFIKSLRENLESMSPAQRYFRWHDSGDIQSVSHLASIAAVCIAVPELDFWLPTKEPAMVAKFLNGGGFLPDNLIVRISAPMVDQELTLRGILASHGQIATSSVRTDGEHACIASKQGGACDGELEACRKCWSVEVADVSYPLH